MKFGVVFLLAGLCHGEEGAEVRELGKKYRGGYLPVFPIPAYPVGKTTPLQLTKQVPLRAGIPPVHAVVPGPLPSKKGYSMPPVIRSLGHKFRGFFGGAPLYAPYWGPPPTPVFPVPPPAKSAPHLAPVIKKINVQAPIAKKAPAPVPQFKPAPIVSKAVAPQKGKAAGSASRFLGKKRGNYGFWPAPVFVPVLPPPAYKQFAQGIPTNKHSFTMPYSQAAPFAAGGLSRGGIYHGGFY